MKSASRRAKFLAEWSSLFSSSPRTRKRIGIPWSVVGNLAATSLRLGLLFLVGREVAAHLGSEGIVVMGQLQNLLGLGLALPSLALQPGIQQALGSATAAQAPERSSWALLSGQTLALLSALVVTGLVLTGSVYLPEVVGRTVWMLVPGICAMALVGNLQAISAGRRRMGKLNLFIAASGPLQALWLFAWIHAGLVGLGPGIVLFGLVAAPCAAFLLSPFPLSWPHRDQWKEQAKLWAPLAAMGSVVAVLGPLKTILFRETLLSQGVDQAGDWQAAARLAELVFATWTSAFSTWALPRLSGPVAQRPGFQRLVLCPLGALGIGIVLASLGAWALELAYVGRFQDALPVLRLQCLAEFIQASTVPLGLILIAHRSVKAYAGLEIAAAILQLFLVRLLVPSLGPVGVPLSIAIESSVYLVAAWWLVRRRKVVTLAP